MEYGSSKLAQKATPTTARPRAHTHINPLTGMSPCMPSGATITSEGVEYLTCGPKGVDRRQPPFDVWHVNCHQPFREGREQLTAVARAASAQYRKKGPPLRSAHRMHTPETSAYIPGT